jgi:hypothetical protein
VVPARGAVSNHWKKWKTVKQPFRSIFWLTLALNITALGYLASDHGAWLVDRFMNML